MRTVTVEVPEGHMVKIVKEESMQPLELLNFTKKMSYRYWSLIR